MRSIVFQEAPKLVEERQTGHRDNIDPPNLSPVVSIDNKWISSNDFTDHLNDYLVDTNVLLKYLGYAVSENPEEIKEYIVLYTTILKILIPLSQP